MRVHPFQVAAILLAFAAYVPAETPPDQPANTGGGAGAPPPHRGGGQMLGMLDKLSAYAESPAGDKDADAAWGATEEHMKTGNKAQFDRMDTDGDGHISRAEAAAALAMIAARIKDKSPELFDKIDTNGDGKLSHDEIKTALDAMHKDHPRETIRLGTIHPVAMGQVGLLPAMAIPRPDRLRAMMAERLRQPPLVATSDVPIPRSFLRGIGFDG